MTKDIDNVGEIVLRKDACFWIYPSAYIQNEEYNIYSPWFSYLGEKWRWVKKPYYKEINRIGTFSNYNFFLWRKIRCSLLKHKYTIRIKLAIDKENKLQQSTGIMDSDYGSDVLAIKIWYTKEIFSRNGFVKLFFEIQREERSATAEIGNDIVQTADEENSENEENTEDEESTEDEGSSGDEMNSENEDNNKKKSTLSKTKGVKKLAQNLKQVFLDGLVTDTVLNVDNREFKVHKLILVARSPVFASMFTHDLAEKNSNSVDIPDCTAESFEVFLHYLYTGSADTISTNIVHNLYYAADKYHVDDLKEKCVKFMKNNLSVETFCDIIALSLRHAEKKLQKAATSFFCENIKKILRTVQWQKYMAENPTQANELLIKAHGA